MHTHTMHTIKLISDSFCPFSLLYVHTYFTVHPTVPSSPRQLTVTREFEDGIELNWLPPTEPNGEVLCYVIYYTPESGTEQSMDTGSNLTHYNLTGLERNRVYTNIAVQAVNSVEMSDRSAVIPQYNYAPPIGRLHAYAYCSIAYICIDCILYRLVHHGSPSISIHNHGCNVWSFVQIDYQHCTQSRKPGDALTLKTAVYCAVLIKSHSIFFAYHLLPMRRHSPHSWCWGLPLGGCSPSRISSWSVGSDHGKENEEEDRGCSVSLQSWLQPTNWRSGWRIYEQ